MCACHGRTLFRLVFVIVIVIKVNVMSQVAFGSTLRDFINRCIKIYNKEIKVENGVESAKIVTNVQTFRDCALYQWNLVHLKWQRRLKHEPRFGPDSEKRMNFPKLYIESTRNYS